MPDATGRFFSRVSAARGWRRSRAASSRAARQTRFSPASPASAAANGPVIAQRKIGRGGAAVDLVADIGEGDETVEQVIAVGAAADDVEIEIELGRRALADSIAATAQPPLTACGGLPRPRSSFASIVFTSSGSGLNCNARRH